MASPAEGALTILQASPSVIAGYTPYIGKLQQSPDAAIALVDTGGFNPNPRYLLDYPTIQVQVRGSVGGYTNAWATAKAIKDRLLGENAQTVGSDRWDAITCLGDIISLGYDDKDRPIFSINFRIILEPATNATTNRTAL